MVSAVFLALFGCNQYDLFLIQDGRDGLGNDVDVLFILDNSESMRDESVALAENFVRFVQTVASYESSLDDIGYDGVEDAVSAYIEQAQFAGGFVDLQIAVTTIGAAESRGGLYGDPPILSGGDPQVVDKFVHTVLCDATCFVDRGDVPTDPDHRCADGFTGAVSQQYLDCECGADEWLGHCSVSLEEGLETAYLALCRAVETPPDECFENGLLPEDQQTSLGFARAGSTYLPVVVTDEGDQSRRMGATEAVPNVYAKLFEAFEIPVTFAVIGPTLNEEFVEPCAPTVSSWSVSRYQYIVEDTGGVRLPVHDDACGPTDWSGVLDQLGALVNGATTAFVLEQPAEPTSIVVEVGGRSVPRAVVLGRDLFNQIEHSDGWSYQETEQTLYLHGDAVPGVEDLVQIWYLPR